MTERNVIPAGWSPLYRVMDGDYWEVRDLDKEREEFLNLGIDEWGYPIERTSNDDD